MSLSPASKNNRAFELKGSLFALTVLHLFNADVHLFAAELRRHAEQSPNLFKNMPLVIDLQRIGDSAHDVDFATLQHQLREYGLIPVGVRHGNEKLNHAAQAANLPILSNQQPKAKPDPTSKVEFSQTLLVSKPVRSGQQIYAKQANLVVLAAVNHGAELLADGYIHAYDDLRGRVLAGARGDKTARIFCRRLEAELISIAGHYLLNESLPDIKAPMVQVYLEEEKICFEGLPEKDAS